MAEKQATPPQQRVVCPTPLSPPSEIEAKLYYAGLPSAPRLVARTGTTPWKEPTGPEADRKLKELHPAGNHPIGDLWEEGLSFEVCAVLESMKVRWASIDICRIGYSEDSFSPVVLWIGVTPGSLSGNDGVAVVSECHKLLVEYDITDVEVEIRESVIMQ